MNNEFIVLKEPLLLFDYGQKTEDPRDGLTLFGPYEPLRPYTINAGVIGTKNGIQLYKQFVNKINAPIFSSKVGRPTFPGFEAVFGITWPIKPNLEIVLAEEDILRLVNKKNLNERTFSLVDLYLSKILKAIREEDSHIDIWFVILPKIIWLNCRPKSKSGEGAISTRSLNRYRDGQGILFPDFEEEYKKYIEIIDYDVDFHNQLKARALQERINIPIQIILETTLQFKDKYTETEYDDSMKAHLAWTQSTTVYYKLGKLPWKLADIRDGVCYLGLVFKKCKGNNPGYACSAAQMFLDSGDGIVFRGNIGPWMSKSKNEYHLNTQAAHELMSLALESYREKKGAFPNELFVHGRAMFTDEEWEGFNTAIKTFKANSALYGVVIKDSGKLKIYNNTKEKACKYCNLRGIGLIIDETEAFLWTRGFVPRLNTSISMEIPNPLRIKVSHGSIDIKTVLQDIYCLTKLNYNACIYGDGIPVTLRFSNNIGKILTAIDEITWKVKSFKFYI